MAPFRQVSQVWRWSRNAVLVLIFLLAAMSFACGGFPLVPLVSGLALHPPTDRDEFFNLVAVDFKQPALCNRIDWRADASEGAWGVPYRLRTLRSKCRSALELPPNRRTSETPLSMPAFAEQVRALGYSDADVIQAAYVEIHRATPTYSAYQLLLADNEFRARLRATPSLGEPRDRARIRPARPIEFMYQMIAIDAREAALCSRISPNATFDDRGSPTALLQSRCYLHIAFNARDLRLCDALPAAGSFPHINEIYDSRERCRNTVAVYRRPDFRGNPTYGPMPFPRATDLQAILREIGYRADTLPRAPEPTAEDYWEFVSRLIFRGSVSDRAEFLRRVAALG